MKGTGSQTAVLSRPRDQTPTPCSNHVASQAGTRETGEKSKNENTGTAKSYKNYAIASSPAPLPLVREAPFPMRSSASSGRIISSPIFARARISSRSSGSALVRSPRLPSSRKIRCQPLELVRGHLALERDPVLALAAEQSQDQLRLPLHAPALRQLARRRARYADLPGQVAAGAGRADGPRPARPGRRADRVRRGPRLDRGLRAPDARRILAAEADLTPDDRGRSHPPCPGISPDRGRPRCAANRGNRYSRRWQGPCDASQA
jgi:hypothetical protein